MLTESRHATAPPLAIRPQPGPQESFLASEADIVIYGGAAGGGKTYGLLMEPLRHFGNPHFGAVIFRKTYPQVRNEGGLWDESETLYPLLGAEPIVTRLEWRFPSGATVRFAHLDHESDKYNWQGSQIALIGFDEVTQFSESQFFYMLSRNRSTCGVRPYVRATCNPDADSWVAEMIAWWIDESTGFPIEERAGIVRWFVRDGGSLIWGDDPEALQDEYPELEPKSLTFIPAKLEDNPALTSKDPGYRANLLALPKVDRERLLAGNWAIRSTEGAEWADHPEYFDRHIWIDDDEWPDAFQLTAMALDGSKGGKSKASDYSAIVNGGLRAGIVYIDADLAKRTAETIARDVVQAALTHGPMVVGVESNGFQDLFAPLIDHECERSGLPPLPIALIHQSAAKEDRIRSLEPYLSRRKIRVRNNEGGRLLVRQLKDFGACDHDDGPDALEMVIRLLNRIASDPDSLGLDIEMEAAA